MSCDMDTQGFYAGKRTRKKTGEVWTMGWVFIYKKGTKYSLCLQINIAYYLRTLSGDEERQRRVPAFGLQNINQSHGSMLFVHVLNTLTVQDKCGQACENGSSEKQLLYCLASFFCHLKVLYWGLYTHMKKRILHFKVNDCKKCILATFNK